MKLLLLICICIGANVAKAQQNNYVFKVEITNDNGGSAMAPFATLFFDEVPEKANAQGMIYLTLQRKNVPYIIKAQDENDYIVVSPDKGLFYEPADASVINVIKLHKINKTEKAVADYKKALKKLDIEALNIDSIKTNNLTYYNTISTKQDSILKIVSNLYNLSPGSLRSATDLVKGRDEYYLPVTAGLEGYLNEAKDIRDIFKNMLEVNLNNPKSFRLLDSTMQVYNKYYNQLNNSNADNERAIAVYWKSDNLSGLYHNVADYAINNVHRTNIIPLNDILIKNLNLYMLGKKTSERNRLRAQILGAINTLIPILDNNLGVLDVKVKTFNTRLQNEKNFLPG